MNSDTKNLNEEKISEKPEKIPEKNSQLAEKAQEEHWEDWEEEEEDWGEILNGEEELWRDGNALLSEAMEVEGEQTSDGQEDPLLADLQASSMEEEEEEGEWDEEEEEEDYFDDDDDFDEEDLDPSNWNDAQGDDLADELQEGEDTTNAAEQLEEVMGQSVFMGKLTKLAFEKADHWRANLCAYISGEHFTLFLSDGEELELVKLAFKEFLAATKVKHPSPFIRLLIAIGAWVLPSLIMAYMMGRGKKQTAPAKRKAKATPKPSKIVTRAAAPTMKVVPGKTGYKSPYKDLKEYKQGRINFKVHSSKSTPVGGYQYGPDGQKSSYRPVKHADEVPSPIIAQWLKEGKNNSYIKEQLYGS